MNDEQRQVVDEAAKGITRAAQNYTTAADYVDALRLWTQDMTRQQLVAVVAQLGGQLSNFYSVDPLAADAHVVGDELRAWLDGHDGF